MYGKHYTRMYEGSMVGAGPVVFAVWGYVIAHTMDSRVTLNPAVLAAVLGADVTAIKGALQWLIQPDPDSRNEEHAGARLVALDGLDYYVPSHEYYRTMPSTGDRRREQVREAVKRHRDKKRVTSTQGTEVPRGTSTHPPEAGENSETSGKRGNPRKSKQRKDLPPYSEPFERVWQVHSKLRADQSKKEAWRAFLRVVEAGRDETELLRASEQFAHAMRTQGREPSKIMHAATFFGPDAHYESDWLAVVGQEQTVGVEGTWPAEWGEREREIARTNGEAYMRQAWRWRGLAGYPDTITTGDGQMTPFGDAMTAGKT